MERKLLQDFTTKELLQELKRREVYRIDRVIDVVCEHFDITREDVKGKTKQRIISEARQIIYYILYKHEKITMTKIAKEMNRKTHSAVLFGYKKIKKDMEEVDFYKKLIKLLVVRSRVVDQNL